MGVAARRSSFCFVAALLANDENDWFLSECSSRLSRYRRSADPVGQRQSQSRAYPAEISSKISVSSKLVAFVTARTGGSATVTVVPRPFWLSTVSRPP